MGAEARSHVMEKFSLEVRARHRPDRPITRVLSVAHPPRIDMRWARCLFSPAVADVFGTAGQPDPSDGPVGPATQAPAGGHGQPSLRGAFPGSPGRARVLCISAWAVPSVMMMLMMIRTPLTKETVNDRPRNGKFAASLDQLVYFEFLMKVKECI